MKARQLEAAWSTSLFRGICRGIRILNAMRRVIHSRALLYLPRRDNVAVSHLVNVFSLFCILLQPAQVPVNAALLHPHPSLAG